MTITVGIDPHKASVTSVTAAALDEHQRVLAEQRFTTTLQGYRQMRRWAACWPQRRWAVEGAGGLGRPVAQRLVADAEHVVDVPAQAVGPGAAAVGRAQPQDRRR